MHDTGHTALHQWPFCFCRGGTACPPSLPLSILGCSYVLPVTGPTYGGGAASSSHQTAAVPTSPSFGLGPSAWMEFLLPANSLAVR